MLKFFRTVRKKLIEEDNVRKYLLYALGEIFLVVIGILIALQVNNWNSDRLQKQKEATYLDNISRDLTEQINTIDAQIRYEKDILKAAKPIITYYKTHQKFKVDSTFTANVGRLTGRMTFVKNNPTYTELISSGNIDILNDKKFKNDLIKYYQQIERMEQIINKNNNLYTDAVFVPGVSKLSEIQLSGIYDKDILQDELSDKSLELSMKISDLNEDKLKAITSSLLEVPENQLAMINAINFRQHLSLIHYTFLNNQKEKTQELLDQLHSQ